jgi:hypothetical protein
MRKLSDEPLVWQYGLHRVVNGVPQWLSVDGDWLPDSNTENLRIRRFLSLAAAKRAWEDEMPHALDAWARSIGIFQGKRDVTEALYRGEV